MIIQEVVQKVNKLFIDTRYMHLIQLKDGSYITSNTKENEARKAKAQMYGKRFRPYTPLSDWKIENHLKGKETVGVFGQSYKSKFLTFDVDFSNIQMSKWVTLQVVNKLIELGVKEYDIHVSFSGNKGYHVDLYFDKAINTNKLNRFYCLVMDSLDYEAVGGDEMVVRYNAYDGQVEMRPKNMALGVKIPLGTHQITKNKCNYVDVFNRFEEYDTYDYFLAIEQMDSDVVDIILDEHIDLTVSEKEQTIEKVESYLKENYTPLPIYKVGADVETTIEAYEKLDKEGLTRKGTRHTSMFKLARYYKFLGLTNEGVKEELTAWLERQDKSMYDSPKALCLKEINTITNYVFEKDLGIVTDKEYINVTKEELLQIMDAQKKNQMLVLFAMLIHSKRYANNAGVFYMTTSQLEQTTNITDKNVRNNVKKLEEQGLIEVVERNQFVKGSHIKKPNKYKVNIRQTGEKTVEIKCGEKVEEQFNKALVELVPIEELRAKVSRRHWEEIRKYYTIA